MCKQLEDTIKAAIDSMKNENAPSFIIADTVHDLRSGDAVVCDGCDKNKECWEAAQANGEQVAEEWLCPECGAWEKDERFCCTCGADRWGYDDVKTRCKEAPANGN